MKNNVKSLLTLLHRDERPLETIINGRYITTYILQPTSPVPGLCLKSRNLILPSFQQEDHTLSNTNFHHLLLLCFWLPTNLILIFYDTFIFPSLGKQCYDQNHRPKPTSTYWFVWLQIRILSVRKRLLLRLSNT